MNQSNMPRQAIPPYYCMPDQKGSLATPPWNDGGYVSTKMVEKGYRVAANEWDNFIEDMLNWPGMIGSTFKLCTVYGKRINHIFGRCCFSDNFPTSNRPVVFAVPL